MHGQQNVNICDKREAVDEGTKRRRKLITELLKVINNLVSVHFML